MSMEAKAGSNFATHADAGMVSEWPEGKPLPSDGYDRAPKMPFEQRELIVRPDQMRPFYGPPGEFGYYIDGEDHGFERLSFILTETHPGGGPDLHRHDTEEAHVLFEARVTYLGPNPLIPQSEK